MNLHGMIDVLEMLSLDDERRGVAERMLQPVLERIAEVPVRAAAQAEEERTSPCAYRGGAIQIQKKCCGGQVRTVDGWVCGQRGGAAVTRSDCLLCAEYVKGRLSERPARTSCVECVEKHLGAAMVLLSETQDGYPEHRLLAIGHLHEAADESRAWPELSQAIRAARIAYQRERQLPDWEALVRLLGISTTEVAEVS